MTRREEVIGDCRLILGDCLEVMPTLEPVDAVVTDPPFGIQDRPMLDLPGRGGRGNNNYHKASEWDAGIDPRWCETACELAPLVMWFGQWRKREAVASAMRWPLRAEIIWAKDTHVGPPCPVAARDERIWVFAEHGVKGATFETSVWDHPIIPTWAHRWHKNEKPVGLMQRCIRWSGARSVLDPFMGSGSTGVAAAALNVRFVGVEQDADHFDIACRRIEEAYKQPRLFEEPAPKAVQPSMFGGAA